MPKEETVFVFCAHSDDQILGPGGTMARYASEGKNVHTFIFSYGERSHPWLKEKVTAEMRIREAQAADKIIGGRGVEFFDLREGKFEAEFAEKKMMEKIAALVKKHKPAKIFIHSQDDPHGDHHTLHRLAVKTLHEIGYKGEIYAFDVWNPLNVRLRHKPRLYIDITESFNTKIRALQVFKSQKHAMPPFLFVYLRAFWHGLHINVKYAERFYKVK